MSGTQQDSDSDLTEAYQGISIGIAHVAVWLAIGVATYIILAVLYDIASVASPHLKIAAFCAAALTTALAAAPFIRFILTMWDARFQEIRNRLNNQALCAYLLQFWETRFLAKLTDPKPDFKNYRSCINLFCDTHFAVASDLFETIYNEQYGKAAFVTPLIFVLATVAVETVLIVFALAGHIPLEINTFGFQAFGAVTGTYMFVVSDCVMATRRRSLNISDVYWYALRLVLAVPVGLAVWRVGGDMMGAFVLGTLPIDQFRKVLTRYAGGSFTDIEKPAQQSDQLIQLEGVTGDISAQLGLEGITSIEQLIGTDPVSLAIRTGLPFKLILRLGSQAVVRKHLRMNAGSLAGIGLADAEPVARLMLRLSDGKTAAGNSAQGAGTANTVILNALCFINGPAAAQADPPKVLMVAESLLMAFQNIADESYTKFLMANEGYYHCKVKGCVISNPQCPNLQNQSVATMQVPTTLPSAIESAMANDDNTAVVSLPKREAV